MLLEHSYPFIWYLWGLRGISNFIQHLVDALEEKDNDLISRLVIGFIERLLALLAKMGSNPYLEETLRVEDHLLRNTRLHQHMLSNTLSTLKVLLALAKLGKLEPCSESANVCLCQAPCDAIDHLGRHQVARHECVNDARELFEVREFELHNLFQELLSEPAVLTMALSESIQLMEKGHQDLLRTISAIALAAAIVLGQGQQLIGVTSPDWATSNSSVDGRLVIVAALDGFSNRDRALQLRGWAPALMRRIQSPLNQGWGIWPSRLDLPRQVPELPTLLQHGLKVLLHLQEVGVDAAVGILDVADRGLTTSI